MSARSDFDPAAAVPLGRSAIEASAGTGKTFTVAGQVTRLVAEGIPIDRILVVTFTRAATAELRDRIRRRLRTTGRALDGAPESEDDHLEVLLAGDPVELALRRDRIAAALADFDRANIHTIHGFASRVLAALGFYSRFSPDVEAAAVDADLVRSAVADALVTRFMENPDGLIRTRDLSVVAAAVIANPDARIVPGPATPGEPGLRAGLAGRVRRDIGMRLDQAGLVGFDQLLIEARDVLADDRIGPAARELVRSRFDAGLVDESQDTDPIQWQIIQSIFGDDQRLVIIGDPKQSIYAFRGADIESYLHAAGRAATQSTLPRNWRSDGPLVHALNVLFEGITFGDDRISYLTVQPAPSNREARVAGPGAPLTVRRFGDDYPLDTQPTNPDLFYKGPVVEAVANDVAAQIVELLESDTTIERGGVRRVVRPGDIAVLCRTRFQVDLVRAALGGREVPSVAARSGSVFTSPAAEEWRRFLHGIERPDIMTRVRLAATTALFGLSLRDLVELADEEFVSIQTTMRRWRDILYESGVPALLAAVDRHTSLAARLLSGPEGERTLTDITHLAEAMHLAWRSRRVGSLLSWLEAEMVDAAARQSANTEEAEARQRRLETDADAVAVETIHGAKGLEYGMVFVPYLWDVPRFTPAVPVFHDSPGAASEPEAVPRERLVDVGGRSGPDFAEHQRLALAESEAEESRLLYVALTRARHRVVLWWISKLKGAADTKLQQILTRYEGPAMSGLVARAGGTIVEQIVTDAPAARRYRAALDPLVGLSRAVLGRSMDTEWKRVSYSSLSRGHPITAAPEGAELPLRVDERVPTDPAPGPGSLPMGPLPAGARFGTLVHEVLERVAFDQADLDRAILEACRAAMGRSRWDFEPEELAGPLGSVIRTPLTGSPSGPRLRDIGDERSRKEMVFHLPIRIDGPATTIVEIAAVMADHLEPFDDLAGYPAALAQLSPERFRGFMTGAIDYVASVPDRDGLDRFVVMDFKSNIVAGRGDVPGYEHFAPDALSREMQESHYVLQALLYQVALHRYLQWRLRSYDPARDLGGAAYLFVRGMTGPDTPVVAGSRAGVYWWRPRAELVTSLSDHLARSAGRP